MHTETQSLADGSGGRKTKGRMLLLVILRSTTREELASKLGYSSEFVGLVANGKRRPVLWRCVTAFERTCGIPPQSWNQRL